jgi:ubiquinone/menaquinone biosynthesis C-methylase UbiE
MIIKYMRLVLFFLRPFYHVLYHQFSWTYDLVAAFVSLDHWQDWVHSVIPFLNGRVLEIGFGPGHLQQTLLENEIPTFGVDESPQMARQANRRLRKRGTIPCLIRGYAQRLPFSYETFDTVVATFPSEYIFDPQTLKEAWRILASDGRLIILPMAWITGTRPLERMASWLFRVTGEAPGKPGNISTDLRERFSRLRFTAHSEIVKQKSSQVLVIVAEKR